MKKIISLLLSACLLAGLAACSGPLQGAEEKPPANTGETLPPEVAPEITYTVSEQIYERTAEADDGTLLATVLYTLPQLTAFDHGEPLAEPRLPAQQAALHAVETFNNEFLQWVQEGALEEVVADAKLHYEASPEFFTGIDGENAMSYSEEFDYDDYRAGSLISISASLYSFLGGAHPNTDFFGWNFDLATGTYFSAPELAEDPQAFSLAVADLLEAQAEDLCAEWDWAESGELADVYWTDYRDILESWSDYAVSFDADGMHVVFAAYALAPYAAGPQEFLLTYGTLDPYWSAEGRAVLGLDA